MRSPPHMSLFLFPFSVTSQGRDATDAHDRDWPVGDSGVRRLARLPSGAVPPGVLFTQAFLFQFRQRSTLVRLGDLA